MISLLLSGLTTMTGDLLEKVQERTTDQAFQSLIRTLIERRSAYERLHRETYDQIARNRANREGITFEQVRAESERGSSKYALRPDEIERMQRDEDERVRNSKSDEELFRMMWYDAEYTWRWREDELESNIFPENLPLMQTLFDYLREDRKLYTNFALAKGWTIPEPMFKKRRVSKLKGAQVRAVRLTVVKQMLTPVGFIKGNNSTYIRQLGNQIHLIDFQAEKYGGSFTINLGFHYIFLRPVYSMKKIALKDIHLLDCAMQERIGFFMPENKDVWFEYGNDKATLKQLLEEKVGLCLAVFDQYGKKWTDPMELATERSGGIRRPWRSSGLAVATIQIRAGRQLDFARAEIKKYEEGSWTARKQLAKTLLNELEKVENGGHVPDEDWFSA